MTKRIALWVLGAFAACGVFWTASSTAFAAEGEIWPALKPAADNIRNLHVVDSGLVRGALPSAEGLNLLKTAGIRTIVNLRNEEIPAAREGVIVRELGMRYVNIPLNVFDQPSDADIRKFLRIAGDAENRPVYVHCQFGQDRTGTMVALYRIKNQGWTASQAFEEMVWFGFKPGLANLTKAVYDFSDQMGRPEKLPSGDLIVKDLKRRIKGRLKS